MTLVSGVFATKHSLTLTSKLCTNYVDVKVPLMPPTVEKLIIKYTNYNTVGYFADLNFVVWEAKVIFWLYIFVAYTTWPQIFVV